jgi:hypothetical protein
LRRRYRFSLNRHPCEKRIPLLATTVCWWQQVKWTACRSLSREQIHMYNVLIYVGKLYKML